MSTEQNTDKTAGASQKTPETLEYHDKLQARMKAKYGKPELPTEHDCPECGEHFSTCICPIEAQHSPLPWSYSDIGGDNLIMMRPKFGSERVAVAEVLYDEATERISIEEMDANKAFIVQCVNHAQALAEALRVLLNKIDNITSDEFALAAEREEREKAREALANWEAAQ